MSRRRKRPALSPLGVSGARFLALGRRRRRAFVPRGFNYDWTLLDGRAARLEDLLEQRADKIATDFSAMRRLGANTVRVFLPTGTFLKGPREANRRALRRLAVLFGAAERNRLRLILTGLSLIRAADVPAWMRRASDATIERAELTFWSALARRGRSEASIFAYDLQNEPAIHWSDNRALVDGRIRAPTGESFFYVHRHYRRIRGLWTRHVRRRFRRESALAAYWPDYPRRRETWSAIACPKESRRDPRYRDYVWFHRHLLSAWAQRLARSIRQADPHHLITVGAFDPEVMADAVDFYSVHLYPRRVGASRRFVTANRGEWRRQIEALPTDKPVLIEEFFPLNRPRRVTVRAVVNALFAATRGRAAGWLTAYFGTPDVLRHAWPPSDRRHQAGVDAYATMLALWRDACRSERPQNHR
jgi:hypothetical protein